MDTAASVAPANGAVLFSVIETVSLSQGYSRKALIVLGSKSSFVIPTSQREKLCGLGLLHGQKFNMVSPVSATQVRRHCKQSERN